MRLPRHVLIIPLVPALIVGCASYAAHEQARFLAQARQDDRTCEAQGWHYPDPRYVSCRRDLEDVRLHKAWMDLQIMRQTQYQPPYAPPAYPYREAYRPLDPDRYRCRYTSENGRDYILCGETPPR